MSPGPKPTSAAKGLPGPKLPESGTALGLGAVRGVRPLASWLTRTSNRKSDLYSVCRYTHMSLDSRVKNCNCMNQIAVRHESHELRFNNVYLFAPPMCSVDLY